MLSRTPTPMTPKFQERLAFSGKKPSARALRVKTVEDPRSTFSQKNGSSSHLERAPGVPEIAEECDPTSRPLHRLGIYAVQYLQWQHRYHCGFRIQSLSGLEEKQRVGVDGEWQPTTRLLDCRESTLHNSATSIRRHLIRCTPQAVTNIVRGNQQKHSVAPHDTTHGTTGSPDSSWSNNRDTKWLLYPPQRCPGNVLNSSVSKGNPRREPIGCSATVY